jgi:hypothetical protein
MRPAIRAAATIIPAFILVSCGAVRGELVIFHFEGKVTHVAIDIPEYESTLSIDWPDVGTSISGFYTFDSTATDTAASPEQGAYHAVLDNAVAVDVRVGELVLQGLASFVATYSSIYQAGDWIPSLELISHPDDANILRHNNFQLSIRKDGLLPGPILPLAPPPLDGAEEARLTLWLDGGISTRPWPYVSIEATLDSLQLASQMPGDFNGNGTVDAADYLVWRKRDNSQKGYDVWRANFGQGQQGTARSSGLASVPEPSTLFLLAVACALRIWTKSTLRPRTGNHKVP